MKPQRVLWLCYGGMVCVAISVNLLPVYLTTFASVFGGSARNSSAAFLPLCSRAW